MDPKLIRQYAEFAVKIGVNPQPGQTLLIQAPIAGAAFARACAEAGYDAGAKEVVGVDLPWDEPKMPDAVVENDGQDTPEAIVARLEKQFGLV